MTDTRVRSQAGRLPRDIRRAQLLDVAQEVFVDQGYHNASMDEIAERAGVSKPVLYQHFPGKLDLYLALLDTSCSTIVDAVRDALASTQDNRKRVEAVFELWFQYFTDSGAAFRLVFESDLTSDPAVRERVDLVYRECAAAIAEVIHDDTGLDPQVSDFLAVGLVGMGELSARRWIDSVVGLDKSEAVALMASLAWRGIGGFPRQYDASQNDSSQYDATANDVRDDETRDAE